MHQKNNFTCSLCKVLFMFRRSSKKTSSYAKRRRPSRKGSYKRRSFKGKVFKRPSYKRKKARRIPNVMRSIKGRTKILTSTRQRPDCEWLWMTTSSTCKVVLPTTAQPIYQSDKFSFRAMYPFAAADPSVNTQFAVNMDPASGWSQQSTLYRNYQVRRCKYSFRIEAIQSEASGVLEPPVEWFVLPVSDAVYSETVGTPIPWNRLRAQPHVSKSRTTSTVDSQNNRAWFKGQISGHELNPIPDYYGQSGTYGTIGGAPPADFTSFVLYARLVEATTVVPTFNITYTISYAVRWWNRFLVSNIIEPHEDKVPYDPDLRPESKEEKKDDFCEEFDQMRFPPAPSHRRDPPPSTPPLHPPSPSLRYSGPVPMRR